MDKTKQIAASQQGFTLVEMIVTITIIMLMMLLGVPSLQTMATNRHADKLAQVLQIDIMFARNQALSLAKDVVIEPNNAWDEGWLIKEGANVLRTSNPSAKAGEIESEATTIEFNKFGRLTSGNAEIKVEVENCTGQRVRTVRVNALGQVVTRVDPC